MAVNSLQPMRLSSAISSVSLLRTCRKPLIGYNFIHRVQQRVICQGQKGNGDNTRRSKKGDMFEGANRRKGRPAHLRSPDDSPFRDGNRDRLVGLLTERSIKTLLYYLMETNLNLHYWLIECYKQNPIPRFGSWEDVSGDTFLRTLLSMPIQEAKVETGLDAMYDMTEPCLVDPRSIAQRIMDIRVQLAQEFTQDLTGVTEENSVLLRESLVRSLESTFEATVSAKSKGGVLHPEVSNSPSISTSSSGPGVAPTPPVPTKDGQVKAGRADADSVKGATGVMAPQAVSTSAVQNTLSSNSAPDVVPCATTELTPNPAVPSSSADVPGILGVTPQPSVMPPPIVAIPAAALSAPVSAADHAPPAPAELATSPASTSPSTMAPPAVPDAVPSSTVGSSASAVVQMAATGAVCLPEPDTTVVATALSNPVVPATPAADVTSVVTGAAVQAEDAQPSPQGPAEGSAPH